MVGELGEARAVDPADEKIGIAVDELAGIENALAHEQNPLSVGRDGRGSKAPSGIGNDALLHAGIIVDPPDFAPPGAICPGAEKSGFPLQRTGIHTRRITRQKIVLNAVAPDADPVGLLTGKEQQLHVGGVDGRIVQVARGDLAADVAVLCIGLEYLVRIAAALREADVLAVGRVGEVQHAAAVGALHGAALPAQILDKDVRAVVSCREIGDVGAGDRNVENSVGEPVDPLAAPLHERHADVIARRSDSGKLGARLFRYRDHRVVDLLGRGFEACRRKRDGGRKSKNSFHGL